MILVDTSVWIDHLRGDNKTLKHILTGDKVISHPFIIGEIACGNLKNREEILTLLDALPRALIAEENEARHLIETRGLFGKGLGWVDMHLLASARLTGCRLWTLDKSLHRGARILKIAAEL